MARDPFDDDEDSREIRKQYEFARIYLHALSLLPSHKPVSPQALRDQLAADGIERTERWVQQLLKRLAEADDLVERDDSQRPYTYRWKPGVKHPLRNNLEDREALTMLLAAAHLKPLLPTEMTAWMDDRAAMAGQTVGSRPDKAHYRDWPAKVAVVSQLPPMLPPRIDPGVLDAVSRALLRDTWLNLDYTNSKGQQHHNRRVGPLALVRQSERLFLVCRFDGYDNVRNLALHRIQRAEATPHPFTRPVGFDLQQYIADGRFGYGNGERMVLEMSVAPHIAALLDETPLSEDQKVIPGPTPESRSVVRATVLRGEQIRWWVRMQGAAVRVLGPGDLFEGADEGGPPRTVGT